MKKNLLIAALFASVCGWAWAGNAAPKNVAAVDVPTIVPTTPGDANGDGLVNVTDIVATVNFIMEKPSDGFNKEAADLNGDGVVNVTDIVMMVKIIMEASAREMED